MGLSTAFLSRGRPLKGPFYLRLSFLATRKRVHELLKAQLIGNLVLLQLIFNVLLDFLFVLSYRIHEVSPGPEMPIAILVLQIWWLANPHSILRGGFSLSRAKAVFIPPAKLVVVARSSYPNQNRPGFLLWKPRRFVYFMGAFSNTQCLPTGIQFLKF